MSFNHLSTNSNLKSNVGSYDPYDNKLATYYPAYQQQLYAISDRSNGDDMKKFAAITLIAQVHVSIKQQHYETYKGPTLFIQHRVLILVHGFNSPYSDVIGALREVASKTQGVYDTVIAYLYPCEKASPLLPATSYQKARANALAIAHSRFPALLNDILSVAERVDIAAHSMGAFLAMSALNNQTIPVTRKVDNLILAGGALPVESLLSCPLSQCSTYQRALDTAYTIYNIYSCFDEILPLQTLFNGERTVGRPNALEPAFISGNVKMVDASAVVDSHRTYLTSDAVIELIKLAASYSDRQMSLAGHYFQLTTFGLQIIPQQASCSTGIDYAIGQAVGSIMNKPATALQQFVSHIGPKLVQQFFPLPYTLTQIMLK